MINSFINYGNIEKRARKSERRFLRRRLETALSGHGMGQGYMKLILSQVFGVRKSRKKEGAS